MSNIRGNEVCFISLSLLFLSIINIAHAQSLTDTINKAADNSVANTFGVINNTLNRDNNTHFGTNGSVTHSTTITTNSPSNSNSTTTTTTTNS